MGIQCDDSRHIYRSHDQIKTINFAVPFSIISLCWKTLNFSLLAVFIHYIINGYNYNYYMV